MSNLIQNPSFEEGLNFWSAHNVTVNDNNPFEGTATARLGPGIASITQDILLGIPRASLLLSFAVEAPVSTDPGNLTVTVKWLNKQHLEIGTGLSMLIPSATIGRQTPLADRGQRHRSCSGERVQGADHLQQIGRHGGQQLHRSRPCRADQGRRAV